MREHYRKGALVEPQMRIVVLAHLISISYYMFLNEIFRILQDFIQFFIRRSLILPWMA